MASGVRIELTHVDLESSSPSLGTWPDIVALVVRIAKRRLRHSLKLVLQEVVATSRNVRLKGGYPSAVVSGAFRNYF